MMTFQKSFIILSLVIVFLHDGPSSLTRHKGPEKCNNSWHFNETEIKPLLAEMKILWPNLFPNSPPDSFWIHEWKYHGTCATSEVSMSTEYKYFKQGLALGNQYPLLCYLRDAGILPSGNKSYKLATIRDVLKKKLGVSIETECFWDKENHQLYLGEIHICMTKDFKPMDCPSDGRLRFEVCSNKEDIHYPVIVHNN